MEQAAQQEADGEGGTDGVEEALSKVEGVGSVAVEAVGLI